MIYKLLLPILLWISIIYTMNAQNIEVPNLPVNNLYDSAILYSFINQPRSIQFSYSALQKIDKTDKKRIAKLFFNIGTQMTDMGRYDLLVAHIDTLFKTAKDLNIELLNGHGHFFKYKLLSSRIIISSSNFVFSSLFLFVSFHQTYIRRDLN